ncbi:DUF5327 family protein [Aquisalibacillus elongatus]|uniref:YwdI family protein n=1 Tax=Aquisalibacillus elongatus TaxID=485577 RepID=A0A3N5BAR2_9BACI|nr:DUF5327 family protein [Aquisalibacillus elongatus]RPF54049.1 hypothetical protein EDC24_1237 [Aquisalibacillus elongatus]
MSVSYHAIIRQMKKELNSLDDSSSQQDVLSKIHVIKSLADVVINSYDDYGETTVSAETVAKADISEAEARAMGVRPKKQEDRMEEDDANGDSIFDF